MKEVILRQELNARIRWIRKEIEKIKTGPDCIDSGPIICHLEGQLGAFKYVLSIIKLELK